MSADGTGPVRPALAVGLAVAGFVALVVAGLGVGSLLTESDVIQTPGLGPVPGVLGVVAATGALAALLAAVLTRPRRSVPAATRIAAAVWIAAAVFLAYVVVTGVAAAASAGDLAIGVGVASALAVRFPGLVVAASALLCAVAAILLVRAGGGRPRWPWEDDEDP